MATIIDMNEIREECKRKSKWKFKLHEMSRKAMDWGKENIETITLAAPVVLGVFGGATKFARSLIRRSTVNREQRWKDTHFYDRSLGYYVKVRRKPTNNELTTISRRKKQGEKLTDILDSMRLLK